MASGDLLKDDKLFNKTADGTKARAKMRKAIRWAIALDEELAEELRAHPKMRFP